MCCKHSSRDSIAAYGETAVPLQPMESMGEQIPPSAHGPSCPPWSSLFLKECILWEGPKWAIHEDLQLVGRTHMGEVY